MPWIASFRLTCLPAFNKMIRVISIPIACMMTMATGSSIRVAVLGSGMSGSSAARQLAEKGLKVTVFEAGRGIGGRMSTRNVSEADFQFDHGAQYIGKPKMDEFAGALSHWHAQGWVEKWEGDFAVEEADKIVMEQKKERWVGCPGMNSLCKNFLKHENIRVVLETRANAEFVDGDDGHIFWNLVDDKTKDNLGAFDWLVASDRLSAAEYRKDLPKDILAEFCDKAKAIERVKLLVAMVVFDAPIPLDFNAVQFSSQNESFGSLGWVAKDSSKPGRHRQDSRECWVLQSHPAAADELLAASEGNSIETIREKAADLLLNDFLRIIPKLAAPARGPLEPMDIPKIHCSVGHRWGAAFPVAEDYFSSRQCDIVKSRHFASCGDYYGNYSGRVEGAYLSGSAAAWCLLDEIESTC